MKSFKLFPVFALLALAVLPCGVHAATVWQTDLPKAQALARAEGKFVLINFTGSDWCGWCIKLRKDVFLKAEFEGYAKSNLVLVEIDFPKRKPQPPVLQSANRKLAEQFQIQSYPTLIVLDGQGTRLGQVSYGNGGPKSFLAEVDKVVRPPLELLRSKVPAKKTADLRRAGTVSTATTETNRADLLSRKITGIKPRRQALSRKSETARASRRSGGQTSS